jgi:hypothetical protein
MQQQPPTRERAVALRSPAAALPARTVRRRAEALGWFSVALGLAQLLLPRAVARAAGAGDHAGLVRALGAREIASGAGLLLRPTRPSFAWLRLAGDVVDLALLGRAMLAPRARRDKLALAIAAVSGVAVMDALTARELARLHSEEPMHVIKSITIHKGPDEVRQLWDRVVESEMPRDRVIVRFTPARMGSATEVRIELLDLPAGSLLATMLARLTGGATPGDLDRALRQFKQLAEIGEIVHSDASVHGGTHPARPAVRPHAGGEGRVRS